MIAALRLELEQHHQTWWNVLTGLRLVDSELRKRAQWSHIHCWHPYLAGHITIQRCCRCGAERRTGLWG